MQETWVRSLDWEDPLEKGKATQLQYPGLENSMDSIVHGVTKSQTRLSDFHFTSIQGMHSVQFSRSVVSDSATPWTAARQASLSITTSQTLLKLMSIKSVMPSNHLVLCHPLLLHLQAFPASGSFPMIWLFASGDQSIGASVYSGLISFIGLIGLISLQSKGL